MKKSPPATTFSPNTQSQEPLPARQHKQSKLPKLKFTKKAGTSAISSAKATTTSDKKRFIKINQPKCRQIIFQAYKNPMRLDKRHLASSQIIPQVLHQKVVLTPTEQFIPPSAFQSKLRFPQAKAVRTVGASVADLPPP